MKFNIYKNGKIVNTIIADESFCKIYCEKNNYSYALVEDVEEEHNIPTMTREDEIDTMLIDHEYRLTLVELGVN